MSNAPGRPKSWKGSDVEAVFEPARHRWQAGTSSLERSLIKSQERSVRLRLFILALLSLGMLAAFVTVLLWGPSKTPVVCVAATNYAWPLPPNAWAYEDTHGLANLHDKNIDWRDTSAAWQSNKQALNDLRLQIEAAQSLSRRSGSLVIYLSMHGAVDGNQHPCLLPAGCSALATDQWIRLSEVLGMLPKASTGIHTLLVLDCVDEQVNWNAGIVQSTFAERVIDWIKEQEIEHCSILLSAAPQQCSWSGPELQSSIFGRELQLALCGAADVPGRNAANQAFPKSPYPNVQSISQAGNQDGTVSLHELTNYLQHRVRDWVRDHRQQDQTPLLISKTSQDVPLVRALNQTELRRMTAAMESMQLGVAKPTFEETAGLWRMLDSLRQRESYRFEPRAWADIEHQLLWLEKLSISGRAYVDQASLNLYPELKKRLQQSLDRASAIEAQESLIARSKVLTDVPVWRLEDASLPSLAWMDLAMVNPPFKTSVVRSHLVTALEPGSSPDLDDLLNANGLNSTAPLPNELNFAQLVRKSGCIQLWPDQSVVRRLFELRDKSESLAVMGDVRGHRLRRQSIQTLDVARRELEDSLFLGPRSSDDRFPQQIREAEQLAEKIESIEIAVERALAIRDRGLAETAYLAAWVCAPGNDMSNLGDWLAKDGANPIADAQSPENLGQNRIDPQLRERIARQRLQRLIDNIKALGAVIQNAPASGISDASKQIAWADEISRDLEAMQYLVQDHIQRALSVPTSRSVNVAQIEALLQLPLIPANDRLALLKKREEHWQLKDAEPAGPGSVTQEWIARVQQEASSKSDMATDSQSSPTPPSSMSQYSSRMQQWPTHPLASLLGIKASYFTPSASTDTSGAKTPGTSESQLIDLLNETLRDHYRSVAAFNARQMADWVHNAELDFDPKLLTDEWSRVSMAANIERMLLPLCPVRPENDASALFIGLALKDQLKWYARRTLADFYADGLSTPHSVSTPIYFDAMVQRILQTTALLPKVDAQDVAELELQRELEILRTLARSGLRTSVKAGIPNPDGQQIGYEINLQPTLSVPNDQVSNSIYPVGTAAAWLQDERGPISTDRQAIALPLREGGANTTLFADVRNKQATNEALVWFRGHSYRAPLFVGQGVVVDFAPRQFDTAQVVLYGDRVQQPSIVFILDCSWSMGEPLAVESMNTATQSRLELAKSHTLRLIEELAQTQDARVGVRLFGHRLGWSRPVDPKTGVAKGSSQVIPQPNYPRSIPEDIVPSRDVEAIVPLGRFTPQMLGPLAKTLTSIVPWGQSPLYLSITEAFKDFSADNQTTTKSIVIITDGDNFQFNATRRPGGDGGAQTSLDDVMTAWQSAKVPLYILGVGIESQSDANSAKSRTTLKSLAERSGGKYYDIENGSDLLRALSEQTSTASYEVERAAARASATNNELASEYKLNETVDLSNVDGNDKYKISFQSITKEFVVQGGESLEMFVAEDGQDIVSQPYDVQSPKSAILARSGETSLVARVHRPQIQDSGVVFPVSLQSPRQHYTPRPKETWIEVSPLSPDGQPLRRTYIFYDTNYDAKTPVPRQSWLASDWPTNSTSADVRIWARYDRAPVSATVSLSELRQSPARWATGTIVNGLPDVTLRVVGQPLAGGNKSWLLHITEIHNPQSRGVGSIRIQLSSSPTAQPRRITRHFDAESRVALHTFEFDLATGEQLLASEDAKLTITTRENVLEQAYQLQGGQPIRVDLVRSLDLLPLPIPAR